MNKYSNRQAQHVPRAGAVEQVQHGVRSTDAWQSLMRVGPEAAGDEEEHRPRYGGLDQARSAEPGATKPAEPVAPAEDRAQLEERCSGTRRDRWGSTDAQGPGRGRRAPAAEAKPAA